MVSTVPADPSPARRRDDRWDDPDLRTAHVVAATRAALVTMGVACLTLGGIALALVALVPDSGTVALEPGLTVVGGGQLLAIAGAICSALALRDALHDGADRSDHLLALQRLHARLGLVLRATLVWCVAATAVWAVLRPGQAVFTLALAAVTAQLAGLLVLVRRHLAGARPES